MEQTKIWYAFKKKKESKSQRCFISDHYFQLGDIFKRGDNSYIIEEMLDDNNHRAEKILIVKEVDSDGEKLCQKKKLIEL